MKVLRVAREWGRFPSEVAALEVFEIDLMNAWLDFEVEAVKDAGR